MKKAAVGFRVHSGWSAAVVVSLEKGKPVVLRRQRLQLVKTFSYTFRQPYHTAEEMELAETSEFVAGVQAEAEALACEALRGLKMELKKLEWWLERGALLLASGRALPEFEEDFVLARHDSYRGWGIVSRGDTRGLPAQPIARDGDQRTGIGEELRRGVLAEACGSAATGSGIGPGVWRTVDSG